MCEKSLETFRIDFRRNFRYELIKTIGVLLQDICEENNILNSQNDNLIEPFIGKNPKISIEDFLNKCLIYSNAESSTFIIMLIYIDRLCEINQFTLNFSNVYKIIFTSFLIALKYHEDNLFKNKFYSKILNLNLKEFIFLENNFCKFIDYKLFIDDFIFQTYYNNLISVIEVCINCN